MSSRLSTRARVAACAVAFLLGTSLLANHPPVRHQLSLIWPDNDHSLDYEPLPEHSSTSVSSTPPLATPNVTIHSSRALASRLQAFLDRPLDFREQNFDNCPRELADFQVDQKMRRVNGKMWRSITDDALRTRRLELVRHIEQLDASGAALVGRLPSNVGARSGHSSSPSSSSSSSPSLRSRDDTRRAGGRGLVMTGGNKDTTSRMLVTLRILRKEHRMTLPVEIFAYPGEISDPVHLREFENLGATVVELKMKKNRWARKNFQIKADAILASSFDDVLYLDSDNVPLRNPEYLFDTDLYRQHGAIFWPDFNKDHPENPIWRLTGRPCDYNEFTFESGQIVINKSANDGLNLAALHITAFMQEENDFYFRLSQGDKDTFRYAFWVLDIPYSMSSRWLGEIGFYDRRSGGLTPMLFGTPNPSSIGRFCGVGMLQWEPTEPGLGRHPRPLFAHLNMLKHGSRVFAPETLAEVFTTIQRPLIDTANETAALAYMRGKIYHVLQTCVEFQMDDYRMPPGMINPQTIIEEELEDAYGGEFIDFGDMYGKHGGQMGGWGCKNGWLGATMQILFGDCI